MEQLEFETNWPPKADDQTETKKEKNQQEGIVKPEKDVEEKERDCPVCGGSGPCYACERGRAVTEEFKKQTKKAKEFKSKKI